jgi:septal ring factor EnvC (AmiA/AmiB activator)
VVRWLFTRGEREARVVKAEAKQQIAIDDSASKLRNELMGELRQFNKDLQERLNLAEQRLAVSEARADSLEKDKARLLEQNMKFASKDGENTAKMAAQSDRIGALEVQVRELEIDRRILIDALQKAGIPLPAEMYRKPVAAPLVGK